jgi:DNA-binding MarR family transcriptional regulator/N-acetylglutamate synthase-like GNAT family acetyltransferase
MVSGPTALQDVTADRRIAAVRAFTRFYTNVIGVLREGLLRTPYSLTEGRVIFELAQRDATEVIELRRTLDIDAGYLSRILSRFETDGLVTRERSAGDARRQVIRLTKQGRAVFHTLDSRSAHEVRALLADLPDREQRRLLGAMATIRDLLGDDPRRAPAVLRTPHAGDYGWVVQRHGALYADEYGWDETFEGLVAEIVGEFVQHHDPQRERAWIAEVDDVRVGCVFCVEKEPTVAQLRLLLVDPRARGMGVGTTLVDECIGFASEVGYARIVLWTNDVLHDARRIYERAGFELTGEEKHRSFGRELVGQYWARSL